MINEPNIRIDGLCSQNNFVEFNLEVNKKTEAVENA